MVLTFQKFGETGDLLENSSDPDDDSEIAEDSIDFVLGLAAIPRTIVNLHPPVEQILELWQLFIENVDPLTKILHPPSLQISLQKAILDLDRLPRSLEALMFVIYDLAVLSLTDNECLIRFGESRTVLLSRYRTATKAALSRARFVGTSNIVVLQALYLHLLSMRETYEPRTLWVLLGIAERTGEAMGLHRDGTYLCLPPFETEMRRRLWYQYKMLDYQTADLSGTRKMRNLDTDPNATKPPLNVNDTDIYPGMHTPPIESNKLTDMVTCSARSEIANFWTKYALHKRAQTGKDLGIFDNYGSIDEIVEKDRMIDELEQILETKYTRYCDPAHPVQLLASMMARTGIKMMRLVAHHPRRWRSASDVPEAERQYVWDLSIQLIESNNVNQTSRQLRRFLWSGNSYFPWQAFIHVLDTLRTNPFHPGAVKAWQLIDEVYEEHPQNLENKKKPVCMAIGTLCLKAFDARVAALAKQGMPLPRTPNYIERLRSQREKAKAARLARQNQKQALTSSNGSSPFEHLTIEDVADTSSTKQPYAAFGTGGLDGQGIGPLDSQHHQNPTIEQGDAFQNQTATDSTAFWFDTGNHGQSIGDTLDMDIDFTFAGGSNPESLDGQMTDWTQWDALLGGKAF